MKNRLPSQHRLLISFIVLSCFGSDISANGQEQPGQESANVAVTVLDQKVSLPPANPSVVAGQRAKLSPEDFAKWQAESRWRPLVIRVSHYVMSDWAERNSLKPTREEIVKLFQTEAQQHLQAYATPEGTKRVALVIGISTSMAVEWVTAKALHEKYGGRIALSSFGGCISIEAGMRC